MENKQRFDTDVLIIGGGPVGLTLATALRRGGVRFRIIDLKAGPEEHSKASNLWPRTQEVFAALGVLKLLVPHATPLHAVSLHAYGKRLGQVPMDDNQSPYPTPLFVGQNVIERELSDHLAAAGVTVERQTNAVSISMDDESVSVAIDQNGRESVVRCRYLVGCDGPSGFTRKQIGLDFEPNRLEGRILRQIDARVRWSRPVQIGVANFFLGDNEYLGYLPLPGGHDRIFVVTPDENVPERKPTLEEMQDAVRRITGDAAVELSDAIWLTRGRLSHGVAESFQVNRVFLAGDAGHMTIPVYGQGMNTGMQDAFNLSWKLKAALTNPIPELLETYNQERHRVRSALAKEQGMILQRAAFPGVLQKFLLPLIAPVALRRGAGEHFRDRSAQLKIAYPESALSFRYKNHAGVGAGDRAPNAHVVRSGDLKTMTLFEEIYAGRWTLLLFMRDSTPDELDQNGRACALFTLEFSDVKIVAISKNTLHLQKLPWCHFDLEHYAHDAYAISHSASLILVRPDGHIGFSAHELAFDELRSYCKRWVAAYS